MKKAIWLCFALAVVMLFSGCGNNKTRAVNSIDNIVSLDDPSFRNTTWGMSRNAVKNFEKLSIVMEDNGAVMYEEITVVEKKAYPIYMFDDEDKLYTGTYLFNLDHTSENLYIDDFNSIAELLDKEYGKGEYNYNWNNNTYKEKEDKWGYAVSIGDLSINATWITNDTKLDLLLTMNNNKIKLYLYYESLTYQRVRNDLAESSVISEDSGPSQISTPEKTYFRNTVWGMTRDEVKQIETLELQYEEEPIILYAATNVAGLSAMPCYSFDDVQKLYAGGYYFVLQHTSESLYIDDFYAVGDLLDEKYGPGKYDYEWKDNQYKDDFYQWGYAISIGQLNMEAVWETPETKIFLELTGDNLQIELNLLYISKTYKQILNSQTDGL